jgi:hypothetical protein
VAPEPSQKDSTGMDSSGQQPQQLSETKWSVLTTFGSRAERGNRKYFYISFNNK